MDINIKSIHFDATEKLREFIEKKLAKLARRHEAVTVAEVTLTVVKPETANNKEASIKLLYPAGEQYASKVADTFEEAVDNALEALDRQLEKIKKQ